MPGTFALTLHSHIPYCRKSGVWPAGMEQVLEGVIPRDERGGRILCQLARELLLMQGSDWPFLLFTTQAKEYATQRFHHHHQRFRKLIWAARDLTDHSRLGESGLCAMEDVDCPWPDIEYALFSHSPG